MPGGDTSRVTVARHADYDPVRQSAFRRQRSTVDPMYTAEWTL